MSELLAIGECMVEFRSPAPGAPEARTGLGGDSLNTAAMAARMGAGCAYLTRLGDDIFKAFIAETIDELGISLAPAKLDADRKNGLYFIRVDARGERSFQYYRAGSAASALSPADLDHAAIADARVVFASGISQAISDSAAAAVVAAARLARETGGSFAYDINFRRALTTEARAAERLAELLPMIDTLFGSEDDFAVLASALRLVAREPSRLDGRAPATLVDAALAAGVGRVVLKQGAGAVLCGDRESGARWQAHPPRVEVRDTTAAGDSFNGAFLSALARDVKLEDALALATAAAALTVTKPGSIGAMPMRAEVKRLAPEVMLQTASRR